MGVTQRGREIGKHQPDLAWLAQDGRPQLPVGATRGLRGTPPNCRSSQNNQQRQRSGQPMQWAPDGDARRPWSCHPAAAAQRQLGLFGRRYWVAPLCTGTLAVSGSRKTGT